jgi:uncharacterized membrane protein
MKNESVKSYFFIAGLLSVILASSVLAITTILFPLDGISGDGVLRFFGRFHPLALHFPITLLVLALGLELLSFTPKPWSRLSALSMPILFLAVFTACITATLGVLLASNEGHMGTLVERHRLLGVSVAILSIVALGLRWSSEVFQAKKKLLRLSSSGTLSVTCLVMMFAAHDGGSMVHGQNYLPQYAPVAIKSLLSASQHNEVNELTLIQSPQTTKLLADFSNDIAPIIERNCSSCHGASKQKAGIRFDELSPKMERDHEVDVWSSVRDALNAHQMPPKEEGRQPSSVERQQVVNWIGSAFDHVAKQRKENRVSPMRRLTVNEYQNTLQELFGTGFKFANTLPSAPISEHGYSRDVELLSVSALELEYFLNIARQSVDEYVLFDENITQSEHYLIEFEKVYFRPGVDGGYSIAKPLSKQKIAQKLEAKKTKPIIYSPRTLFPLPEGPLVNDDEEGLLKLGYKQKLNGKYARLKSKLPHKNGVLVARVHVSSKMGDDGSVPRLEFKVGKTIGTEIGAVVGGECDVTAPFNRLQICIFKVPLEEMPVQFRQDKSTNIDIFVFNKSRDPDASYALAPEGLNTHPKRTRLLKRHSVATKAATLGKAKMRKAGVNELYLDAIEIDIIPFGVDDKSKVWNINTPNALSGDDEARMVAEKSLKSFMERAYRRTVSSQELDDMVSLYNEFRNKGDNFENALKETFSSVLISTPFLYVSAPVSVDSNQEISTEERSQIASRLSYFLWSGPPDEQLLELAAENRLSDPAILAVQVDRMLKDEKSRRFSSRFAREWLRLDKFDLVSVNPEFYPFYDEDLGKDMVAETISTFQEVFHRQKDARELISSDTVYINQRLARHYGFPAVTGGEMQATKVPNSIDRGGILQQAAILTMTADGAESNPIYRGVWVLERVLNDPPPPPPPSVPPLEEPSGELGPLTLIQKIELHRTQSACSACHANIDPWGLPFESFDAIGAWREKALVINPETSAKSFLPIDSRTTLATGEKINGSEELVSYLFSEREEEFTRSLVWHMMTYALGRVPNLGDEHELKTIHSHFRASGYKFSALVLAIAQSEAFQVTSEQNGLAQSNAQHPTLLDYKTPDNKTHNKS